MPLGAKVEDEGTFAMDGDWPVLWRDQGGRWRLDVSRNGSALLGRRVRL